MKRIFITIIFIFSILLSGCDNMGHLIIESVEINDKTYKTGFYNTMFPHIYHLYDETYSIKNTNYYKLTHDNFDLIFANIGEYTEGTIFCNKEQFDDAIKYYSNPQNFSYYSIIGNETSPISLENIDTNVFDKLLNFADKSEYKPLDSEHNNSIETIEIPIPNNSTPEIVFYKESKDLLFTSNKGHKFYIIDDVLYFVFYFDYDSETDEKLVAVKVPDEISRYVVDYMKPYLK